MKILFEIQAATLAARKRTGDDRIGTCVKRGLFSIVRVTYNKRGTSTVETLAKDIPASDIVRALDALQAVA